MMDHNSTRARHTRTAGLLARASSAIALSACAVAAVLGSPANAETLQAALNSTYSYSPQLDAERARSRAVDENVSQAHGQFRPTITGNGSVAWQNTQTRPQSILNRDGDVYPKSLGVTVTQPIFRGFRTINGINVAEAQVRAERETLRTTEQTVLIGAVTAYMDVVRDEAILKLRENNQRVLADTLKSTQDQFRVGEVTRTDVAQAEASLQAAISAIELAKANLKTSRATFERYVGHAPSNLVEPKPLSRMLPKSLQEAINISNQEYPTVVGALYNEQAARWNVDLIRGELLPTVSIQGSYQANYDPSQTVREQDSAEIVGNVSVPIYEQGIVYSRVRQAKHQHVATLQEIARTKTEAQNNAVAAWSQQQASRAQLSSDRAAVESNRVALSGVREEEKVGQRTKLDVLNAEQAYLNAQVNLVTTRRNVIVNDYTLVQAIGRLNMQELGASTEIYDVEQNYFEVRRKWWGLNITHADGHREHLDLWSRYGENHESMK